MIFSFFVQKYFQSGTEAETRLTIEWTNQHGCGGNEDTDTHKLNCNLVIQYMVQDYEEYGSTQAGKLLHTHTHTLTYHTHTHSTLTLPPLTHTHVQYLLIIL